MNNVARNTIYLTGASVLQKAISFLYFSVLARHFGAQEIGAYTFALGFTSLFSILVDGGLTPILIREIAKKNQPPLDLLKKIAGSKIILLLVAVFLIALTVRFLPTAHGIWPLILVATGVMALDSFNLTAYGVLRGLQKLHFESIGVVGAQIITLISGGVVIIRNLTIEWAIGCLGLAALFNLIFVVWVLHKENHRIAIRPTIQSADNDNILNLRQLFQQAAPFLMAGIFARGYSYLDSILLGVFASFSAAGLFGVANKLIFAFQFIPLALAAVIYPAFANLLVKNSAAATTLWLRAERYLLAAAIFISSTMIMLSKQILTFYGQEFLVARFVLIILAFSLLFSFLSYPVGALLNAGGKQKLQTTAMGLALMVNLSTNLILIPRFGIWGAAISAALGNFILFLAGAIFVEKFLLKLPWKKLLSALLNTILAISVVIVLMLLVGKRLPWPIVGFLGFLLYGGASIVFRVINKDDWIWLRQFTGSGVREPEKQI